VKQLGLFSRPYPTSPGYQSDDCSYQAAKVASETDEAVRALCLACLAVEDLTSDEIAERLRMKPTQVRPRCSQLYAAGKIIKAGRRQNADGNFCNLWSRRGLNTRG